MYVSYLKLLEELQRNVTVQVYQVSSEQIITNIEMFPSDYDPYKDADKVRPDTLYLCEYWQLKRIDPHALLPPLLCVVEAHAGIAHTMFSNRCIAAVYGSTVVEVLLSLTNAVYDLGCKSSLATEISRSLVRCRTIPDLVREGFRALKDAIIVTDYNQKILFYTDPDQVSSPVYRNILASEYLPVGHPTASTTATSWNELDIPFVANYGEQPLFPILCKPLSLGTVTLGYLHVVQFTHQIDVDEYAIVELLGNLITAELWKQRNSLARGQNHSSVKLCRDILDNLIGDEDAVLRRAQELRLTFRPWLYALVFNLSPKNSKEHFDSSNRILFSDLVSLVNQSLPGVTAFLYRNSVFAVVQSDTEITDFGALLARLQSEMERYHLVVGVSNAMPGIHMLREAGYQCRKAIQLGSALHPEKQLYEYQNYTIYYMIELCLKDENLFALCPPFLRKLILHSKENGPELLETLKVYLKCGRSKTVTAKEMFVHVNTIKYRIGQIQEICGLDLSDDETALSLMLAFKMFEYREKFSEYIPITND